ncbi:hypothetical protein EMCRGX_G024726 [Ephydatia muelleri]
MDSIWATGGFVLDVFVKVVITLVVLRGAVWLLFLLVKKLWGIRVSSSGWMPFSLQSFEISMRKLEVRMNRISVALRWRDRSSRKFLKLYIDRVQIEYTRSVVGVARKARKSKSIPAVQSLVPSRKRRLVYWLLSKLLKLTEVTVRSIEVSHHDDVDKNVCYTTWLQLGSVHVMAQPLDGGTLVATVDIQKGTGEFLLRFGKPHSKDILSLAEWSFGCKLYLFLCPLRVQGTVLDSVQLSVGPVSLTLQEGFATGLKEHIGHFTRSANMASMDKDTATPDEKLTLSEVFCQLPEKFEVVLEDIKISYQASQSNRSINTAINRLSAITSFKRDSWVSTPSTFEVTLALQGVKTVDGLSNEMLQLRLLKLTSKRSPTELSSQLCVESLQLVILEGEVVFWTLSLLEGLGTFRSTEGSKAPPTSSGQQALQEKTSYLNFMFGQSIAVVTTFELVDWCLVVRMEAPSLQSREPLCSMAMASCASCLRWARGGRSKSARIKASLSIKDLYLHVPGLSDNTTQFSQRVDNPSLLPSHRQQVWGRAASLGSFHAKGVKEVLLLPTLKGSREVKFSNEPLRLSAGGDGLMLEWSKPLIVTVTKTLNHLRSQYKLFAESTSGGVAAGQKGGGASAQKASDMHPSFAHTSLQVTFSFHLVNTNVFVCGLTPAVPTLMMRLDLVSVSKATPTSSFMLQVHELVMDSIGPLTVEQPFFCSLAMNLPAGAIMDIPLFQLSYNSQDKELQVSVSALSVNWTTTSHCCVLDTVTYVSEGTRALLAALLKKQIKAPPTTDVRPYVSLGDVIREGLATVPVKVGLTLEKAECNAVLDVHARASLGLQMLHIAVDGGSVEAHTTDLAIKFDGHDIISVSNLMTKFPYTSEETSARRRALNGLQLNQNPTIVFNTTSIRIIFPFGYKFAVAYDKLLNIKKFVQTRGKKGVASKGPPLLLPDILLEVEDLVFKLCDDPFEVKLRTNYELMCDEDEQKSQRLKQIEKKLGETRKQHGERLSAKKVQGLYESLEKRDAEIFVARALKIYESEQRTELFLFALKRTSLLLVSDPSMLTMQDLTTHMKAMDPLSPLPDGYMFSTLWGLRAAGEAEHLEILLRDVPEPLFSLSQLKTSARLVAAEKEATDRERRRAVVLVGSPWGNTEVERKMPPLKLYYDVVLDCAEAVISYGPCLDPILAQIGVSFDLLTMPTVDPSPRLPFWDKLRLLYHGSLRLLSRTLTLHLPATPNPYNLVERLEVSVENLDATLQANVKLDLAGLLKVCLHTASKYDEQLVLSNAPVKATIGFTWESKGSPSDHHAVVRCAPDKVPHQPAQVYDSYSLFRSQYFDLKLVFDIQPSETTTDYLTEVRLYASTLRWFQQYQTLYSRNVVRPIRKGKQFNVLRTKRTPILRHCRELSFSISVPRFKVIYWSSVALQEGVECTLQEARFDLAYHLKLVPFSDGLQRRERASWAIQSCHGSMKNLTVFSCVGKRREGYPVGTLETSSIRDVQDPFMGNLEVTRCLLLSMASLDYTSEPHSPQDFTHQLKTVDTKILWSISNKGVVFTLMDAYKLAQTLKQDLSTEALHSILTKLDSPIRLYQAGGEEEEGEGKEESGATQDQTKPKDTSRKRSAHSPYGMLELLLADMKNKVVSAEERNPSDPLLKGPNAVKDDVIKHNWSIELLNIQITLHGIEQSGFLIVSSNVAQIYGREHEPKVREGDLVKKTSWVSTLSDVQYFMMVGDAVQPGFVPWLPTSVISSPPVLSGTGSTTNLTLTDEESEVNALLLQLGPSEGRRGSLPPGEAVGGLVSCYLCPFSQDLRDVGGAGEGEKRMSQMQRIAARCHCNVYYVTYGGQVEAHANPEHFISPIRAGQSPPIFQELNEAVDTVTVRYPSAEICTTAAQYSLIADILNNLLLHKEAREKEVLDEQERMKFALQLSDIDDPRKTVLAQQNKLRKCLKNVRSLEKHHFIQGEESSDLEGQLDAAKKDLYIASLKLRSMIRAFKERKIFLSPPVSVVEPVRRIEVWLDDATWGLMHEDGQLKVADISLINLSYNRLFYSDDSGEHRLELGSFKVLNLMPNVPPAQQEVVSPYDPMNRHLKVDKNISLRVFCRDRARVGGIPVTEHLELNIIPLGVCLTARFYKTIHTFFFPKMEVEEEGDGDQSLHASGSGIGDDQSDAGAALPIVRTPSRRTVASSSSVTSTASSPPASPVVKESGHRGKHTLEIGDVEKMKERASSNKTFIYVKIPQLSLCITYRSSSVNLNHVLVTVPTLEYHNRCCTWTDMLMEIKKDYKSAIIHQTLKSAIGMKATGEMAGLASPRMGLRTDDLLMGKKQSKQAKGSSSRTLFGKMSREAEDTETADSGTSSQPLDQELNLKKAFKQLTKLSQEAQK